MQRGRGSGSMWVAVAGIACLYVGSTLPTPLYPLYQQQFGFSEFIVTAIYASYVVGNLTALFALGRLSDQLGRRHIERRVRSWATGCCDTHRGNAAICHPAGYIRHFGR